MVKKTLINLMVAGALASGFSGCTTTVSDFNGVLPSLDKKVVTYNDLRQELNESKFSRDEKGNLVLSNNSGFAVYVPNTAMHSGFGALEFQNAITDADCETLNAYKCIKSALPTLASFEAKGSKNYVLGDLLGTLYKATKTYNKSNPMTSGGGDGSGSSGSSGSSGGSGGNGGF